MKLWDLYYWNKHEYCWKWIGMAEGNNKQEAIRMAVQCLPEAHKRGDVMKVEEYARVPQLAEG